MSPLTIRSPVIYLAAITLLLPPAFAYAIAFINPFNRLFRASILLLSVAIVGQLQWSVPVFTGNFTYDGMFMSCLWIFLLRTFDLLFWKEVYLNAPVDNLQQIQFSAIQPGLSKFLSAWRLLFNFRNINTEWTIRTVPTFSSRLPEYVPNKKDFVKRRFLQVLLTYLTLDAVFTSLPPPNPSIDIPEHKQLFFSRLHDVTFEEIIARPITVLLPALSIYGIFNIPYNIASIFSVLFCGGEPGDWPPLFGNFREAYTLRRFWG
jgi:hypothetical protein